MNEQYQNPDFTNINPYTSNNSDNAYIPNQSMQNCYQPQQSQAMFNQNQQHHFYQHQNANNIVSQNLQMNHLQAQNQSVRYPTDQTNEIYQQPNSNIMNPYMQPYFHAQNPQNIQNNLQQYTPYNQDSRNSIAYDLATNNSSMPNVPPQQPVVVQIDNSSKDTLQYSGFAITSLVCGILALSSSWIPIVNNGAFLLGIISVIFAAIASTRTRKGVKRPQRGHGFAVAGMLLGIFAIIITLATQYSYVQTINKAVDEYNTQLSQYTNTLNRYLQS